MNDSIQNHVGGYMRVCTLIWICILPQGPGPLVDALSSNMIENSKTFSPFTPTVSLFIPQRAICKYINLQIFPILELWTIVLYGSTTFDYYFCTIFFMMYYKQYAVKVVMIVGWAVFLALIDTEKSNLKSLIFRSSKSCGDISEVWRQNFSYHCSLV